MYVAYGLPRFWKKRICILIVIQIRRENDMILTIGKILNFGILVYLGYLMASCMGTDQIAGANAAQNPWILSFLGIVALYFAVK